jgi:hypothetical protein
LLSTRPTAVTDGDEMLALKRPLAGSPALIECRSETKLRTCPFVALLACLSDSRFRIGAWNVRVGPAPWRIS